MNKNVLLLAAGLCLGVNASFAIDNDKPVDDVSLSPSKIEVAIEDVLEKVDSVEEKIQEVKETVQEMIPVVREEVRTTVQETREEVRQTAQNLKKIIGRFRW